MELASHKVRYAAGAGDTVDLSIVMGISSRLPARHTGEPGVTVRAGIGRVFAVARENE